MKVSEDRREALRRLTARRMALSLVTTVMERGLVEASTSETIRSSAELD